MESIIPEELPTSIHWNPDTVSSIVSFDFDDIAIKELKMSNKKAFNWIYNNCGVFFKKSERYQNSKIFEFIKELREKYMGDIFDIKLSKGKPVQLMPFFNFADPNKHEIYKRHNFHSYRNLLENLSEISFHLNNETEINKLILFLKSVPNNLIFNIFGNIEEVENCDEFLSFLNNFSSPKIIVCSYSNIFALKKTFSTNFSYKILIQFPLQKKHWNKLKQFLVNQTFPCEYVFNVSSLDDYQQAEQFITKFKIENYQIKPLYNGNNIIFFEENVFLTKEDILSCPISIKDIFANQAVNFYDFGKINIMPNGDAYANLNHSVLGNIFTHSIYEIVQKEISEGQSWFRIRNQAPCNKCVYQWLCPSPSDYEISLDRINLCHIDQK